MNINTLNHFILVISSYIAVYKKANQYVNILALKVLNNNLILSRTKNFPKKIQDFKLKYMIEESTYNHIYAPWNKEDTWDLVKGLHIHHKYYQVGLLAWEYPIEALITLCWECHENLHKNTTIPLLDKEGNKLGKLTPCHRCHGAGMFPEYVHIYEGICFRCDGAKYEELI